MAYVTGGGSGTTSCIFCVADDPESPDGRDALIVSRARLSFIILNRFPYNNGHLLIAPRRHVATLSALTPDELSEMMWLARNAELALTEAYRPNGINVGMNLGHSAGAGIADHLHIHVVPRWTGDTNFMSVVADTRVLPEELGDTAARLRPIFARLQQ
jgi:ATP adenylyltransferase